MSESVATQIAFRMYQHAKNHDLNRLSVVFHGGEPLLGGAEHLNMLISVIKKTFRNSGVKVSIGVQSNGLLFSHMIGDLMLNNDISLGISVDGPPKVNDMYRVDHQGKPSSARLEQSLSLLTSVKYRKIFSGFLCVINIESNPLEVTKYLLSYNPRSINFLFPDNNHDRRPPGKYLIKDDTSYGDWLIKVFDYWFNLGSSTK